HLIDALAPISGKTPAAARITEAQALGTALAALYPNLESPALILRQNNVPAFEKTAFFHSAPTVERVAIPMKDSSPQIGFRVTTWSEKGNLLHVTLVSGSGAIISTELRTHTDRYKIFPENPDVTPQTMVNGPGSGNAESPSGWLAGSQLSLNI